MGTQNITECLGNKCNPEPLCSPSFSGLSTPASIRLTSCHGREHAGPFFIHHKRPVFIERAAKQREGGNSYRKAGLDIHTLANDATDGSQKTPGLAGHPEGILFLSTLKLLTRNKGLNAQILQLPSWSPETVSFRGLK